MWLIYHWNSHYNSQSIRSISKSIWLTKICFNKIMFYYIISKMDEIVATPIFPSMMFTQNSIKKLGKQVPLTWNCWCQKILHQSILSKLYPHYVERGGPSYIPRVPFLGNHQQLSPRLGDWRHRSVVAAPWNKPWVHSWDKCTWSCERPTRYRDKNPGSLSGSLVFQKGIW